MQRLSLIAVLACGAVAVTVAGVTPPAPQERTGVGVGEIVDIDDLGPDLLSINGRTYRLA